PRAENDAAFYADRLAGDAAQLGNRPRLSGGGDGITSGFATRGSRAIAPPDDEAARLRLGLYDYRLGLYEYREPEDVGVVKARPGAQGVQGDRCPRGRDGLRGFRAEIGGLEHACEDHRARRVGHQELRDRAHGIEARGERGRGVVEVQDRTIEHDGRG